MIGERGGGGFSPPFLLYICGKGISNGDLSDSVPPDPPNVACLPRRDNVRWGYGCWAVVLILGKRFILIYEAILLNEQFWFTFNHRSDFVCVILSNFLA